MALRVTLAGRVGIEVDGGEVTASGLGRPGRLALAYLTCERYRAVPRGELAEILWGDERPQSWDQMLRGLALKLRGVLSAAGLDATEALSTAAGTFRLHLPAGATVDVDEAASALESAQAALAAGYPGRARVQASAALEVTSRQFAPTLSGAWVERRQAELAELHLRALEALARAALAEGDWPGAIVAAEEAIAREPFRESAYLVLMDAHAGAGNRGEALRAYSRCREALVEELGVGPSPPTEAAYLRLLGEEPAPTKATSAALPLSAALAPVPGSFLVGRTAEVETLEAALKRAGVEGRQAVLVGGEPGAGKTTLVAAVARAAHAGGARVLYGRCDEELAMAYQPFAQALGHYVATAPTAELRTHVASHGGTLARLIPELSRRLPEATPPPPTDAESDRWALYEAVTDILVRAAKDTTVVLVLDDLHWAAPATLALLRHLLADPSPAALLILGTYRHTDTPPGSPLDTTLADLRRAPAVERTILEGLDADGVVAFVEATGADDDGALAAALHAHTAGNPFFVGQLLRHLAETGATYRRQAPWSYYADAHGLEVPDAAVEVVGRRLGRLSGDANRALVLASVTGAEFDLDVIEAAGGDHPDTVLDGLEEAQAASLIVELDRPGHYRFAHALVRDAIYGKLSAARRARLHRQVGEALESLPGDGAVRLPDLAHHFAQAAPAGSAAKAVDYGIAAADHLLGAGAADSAVGVLERALPSLEQADPTRQADLHLTLARTYLYTSDPRCDEQALAAFDASRRAHAFEQMAQAACTYNAGHKPDPRSVTLLEEALASPAGEDSGIRARLLSSLALQMRGEERLQMSAEALSLARQSGDLEGLGVALRGRAIALYSMQKAQQLLGVAEALVAEAPPGAWVGWRHGLRMRAIARLMSGDRDGFDADVDEVEVLGRRPGQRMAQQDAMRWRVSQALLDGDFEAADRLLSEARAAPRDSSWHDWVVSIQSGWLAWEQGRLDVACAVFAPMVAERPGRFILRAQLALAHLRQGDREAAAGEYRTLSAALSGSGPDLGLPLASVLTELAVALGHLRDDDAAQLTATFSPFAGQAVVHSLAGLCLGSVDRYLGILAGASGNPIAAQEWFESALRVERGLRSPPLVARTTYWYADALLRNPVGDRRNAASWARDAARAADELGMAELAQDAKALLTGGHEAVNGSSTPPLSALSEDDTPDGRNG